MAIYHMQAKVVSRGSGRSAVAASAYMSCSHMYNDYDGIRLYCHFDLFNKRFHFNETLVTLIHSIALICSTTDCFAKMCL